MKSLQKAKTRIKKLKGLPYLAIEAKAFLEKFGEFLTEDEQTEIIKEIEEAKATKLTSQKPLHERFKSHIYTYEEIKNAPATRWLVQDLVPSNSIGVMFGDSGVGKTTVVLNICTTILTNKTNVYIFMIDGDMNQTKIQESDALYLLEKFPKRFFYVGKQIGSDFSESVQELLSEIVEDQINYPDREYFVIQDSLMLTVPKKSGFVDTQKLYFYEKILRKVGGSTLFIHHLNKDGNFADSQQIINYADYSFSITRNKFNSTILLHPQKASRYAIEGKAFLTENRKIVKEVEYEAVNIEPRESKFVSYVLEALEDGEMNQSELISHLEKMRFFSEYKVGQKKATKWLIAWGNKGKWSYERRPDQKNAIYFWIEQKESEKVQNLHNLKNCQTSLKNSLEGVCDE
ncbi:MAG: AAA family ATPase [Arcobacter butzleri]|nr:AAA family ATPase [Aliarcobacter butzleri]